MKFGFPVLAWSTVEFQSRLKAKNELSNASDAIKWSADYFIKAHPQPEVLSDGEAGDGDSDHACWERPEGMTTPRTTFKIDDRHPCADLAAETAAASIAFKPSNSTPATELIIMQDKYEICYDESIIVQDVFGNVKGRP